MENIKFINTDCYKNLQFEDKNIKEMLPTIGIGNQGNLLMTLYSMLVIPKELISKKFPTEFSALNTKLESMNLKPTTNYQSDSVKVDYVRHIRNAVAHARITIIPQKSVTFIDENKQGEKCTITLTFEQFGVFLTELQSLFMKYIETIKQQMMK